METWELLLYGGLLGVIIFLVKKFFQREELAQVPSRPRIEKRDLTMKELREFDGSDPNKPILLAVKGTVYDVTSRSSFYGPGAPYHCFAGRDASRGLAKGVTDAETADNPNIDDLTEDEKDSLNQWEMSYQMKYEVIGKLVEKKNPNIEVPSSKKD